MLLSKQGRIIGTDDVRHEIAAWIERDCDGAKGFASVTVVQDGKVLVLRNRSEVPPEEEEGVETDGLPTIMEVPVCLDREAAEELGWYLTEWARTGWLPSHPYLGQTATAQAGAGAGPS